MSKGLDCFELNTIRENDSPIVTDFKLHGEDLD